jgi:endoglucanase
MRAKHLLLAAVLISGCLKLSAQSNTFISVKGKEIIGTDGKPFLMRGTNLGNWLIPEGYMFKFKATSSPRLINQLFTELIGPDATRDFWERYLHTYVTQTDIHYLKSIGVNSIRVPFNYRLFADETYLGTSNPNRGFELIDPIIKWCKAEGIYVLLDMHCAPGGQTGDNIDDGAGYPFLFESEASQALTAGIWKRIAAHYKNETTVMGYDLLNEPIAHYFDKEHFNPLLEPLFKRITKAVREVDKNHLVFLGGAQWDSNFKVFGAPFDSKLVYTFHKYWTKTTQDVIQEYLDFRDKYNVPIYCGETGENNDQWVTEFRQLLEKNNIGYHYWPYKKMNSNSGVITFDQPTAYQKVIDYEKTDRSSFEAIRKAAPANRKEIVEILNGMIENSSFKNCKPNAGYITGLGFTPIAK